MPDPKLKKDIPMIHNADINAEASATTRPWTMNVTSPSSDFEAPKDPGAQKSYTSVTDNEILGHRSTYIGSSAPGATAHRHGHHGHQHHGRHGSRSHHHRHRRGHHGTKATAEKDRPGSGSGGSSGSDFAALCKKDYAACQLKKHNELRKKHGSPAMTLNAQMNKKAEAWAQENANNHRLKHSADGDRNGNGENLWMGCGKDPAQATQDWYDEMTNPGYDFNNPGWNANPGTGHFTQVIWKASTELGIGKAVADDGCVYVCARYAPGGNMMGDFPANVKKPNN